MIIPPCTPIVKMFVVKDVHCMSVSPGRRIPSLFFLNPNQQDRERLLCTLLNPLRQICDFVLCK